MGQVSRKTEFLEILDELPEEAQDRAIDLVRCLAGKRGPVPGSLLASLHGILDPEQARQMTQAIADGCETIDANDW